MATETIEHSGLPCDLEAEKMILAQPIVNSGSMPLLRGCVEPDFFLTERMRRTWTAMCELFDQGLDINASSVAVMLRESGHYYDDPLSFFDKITDGNPILSEVSFWVDRIAEFDRRRKLISACRVAEKRLILGDSSDSVYDSLTNSITSKRDNDGIESTSQMIERYGVDALIHGTREDGIAIPWIRLNAMLRGLQRGQLILLAAHTSQGKTSAGLQIAMKCAEQRFIPCYFSVEMRKRALFRRMVSQRSEVDSRTMYRTLTAEQRERQLQAAEMLDQYPVMLDHKSHSVPQIIASLRSVGKTPGLGVVLVDYLQILQTTGRFGSRAHEVGTLARELKLAALDFDVPVVLLSQFSRESAKAKMRPELHDLKESGDIENHADVVIILHTTDLDPDLINRPVQAYVPKQREGPRGKWVDMLFRSEIQKFEEIN